MDPASRSRSTRSRRRRRRRLAAVTVLVLALLGIGGQWIGSGEGTAAPGGNEHARPDARETPVRTAHAGDRRGSSPAPAAPLQTPPAQPTAEIAVPVAAPPGEAPVAASPVEVPMAGAVMRERGSTSADVEPLDEVETPEPPTRTEATETTEPSANAALDDDRFASLLSLVRSRVGMGDFGEARDVLGLLAGQPLTPAQRAATDAMEREVEQVTVSTCREVLALAERGSVLAARTLASRGLRDDAVGFGRALSDAFDTAGLGSGPSAPPSLHRARWPVPAPLARERMVRAMLDGDAIRGAVVDSRSDRVTLRVQGARGLTFPTVALSAVEPCEVGCAEAAELGFAALHAGDPLLARLWLRCARGRLPAAGNERCARLLELLR